MIRGERREALRKEDRRERVRTPGRLKTVMDATFELIRRQDYLVAPPVIYVGVPDVGCMSVSKKAILVMIGEDERDSSSWRYATEEEKEKLDKFMNRTEDK